MRNPQFAASPSSSRGKLLASVLILGSLMARRGEAQRGASGPSVAVTPVSLEGRSPGAAKVELEAAITQHPEDPNTWYELGRLQGRLHDFPGAEASLRRAIALDPRVAKAHYQLGLTLVGNPKAKLDWPGAIAEFRTALKLQPAFPDALAYLGVGLTAIGQNEDAIRALTQAVQLAPGLASAHFNLALALESAGKNVEAMAEYQKAATLRPSFPEDHSALGKLLSRMGDRSAAESELRTALRENPDLQDAHYGLSQILRATGRAGEAKDEAEIALALGRQEPDGIASSTLSNAALGEAAKGNLPKAESMLRDAILLRPDYGVPHYNLGLVLADRGDWQNAISQLSQATSLMPDQAKPWFDLGRVLRLGSRLREGASCIAWAAKLSPGDARIASELKSITPSAPVRADSGPKAPEDPDGRPAFGALSDTADGFSRYADALRDQGDTPGEIGARLKALAFVPVDIRDRLLLAAAYQRLDGGEKARQEYRKVLFVQQDNTTAKAALRSLNSPLEEP